MIAHACDLVKKRPLPVLAGAVVLGVALGCFIAARGWNDEDVSAAHRLDEEEPVSDLAQSISSHLAALKFW